MTWAAVPAEILPLDVEVSEAGEIRRHHDGLALSPSVDPKGYLYVNVQRKLYLHRAVLAAFDRLPLEGEEGRHLGKDSQADNSVANLAWGTSAANKADKRRHGTQPQGEGTYNHKLTAEIIEGCRVLHNVHGWSFRKLAELYGIAPTTIFKAVTGLTWQHLSEVS